MPEAMDYFGDVMGLLTTKRSLFGAVDGFPRCNCRRLPLGRSRQFLGEQCQHEGHQHVHRPKRTPPWRNNRAKIDQVTTDICGAL